MRISFLTQTPLQENATFLLALVQPFHIPEFPQNSWLEIGARTKNSTGMFLINLELSLYND
jgi:hypothetical protein